MNKPEFQPTIATFPNSPYRLHQPCEKLPQRDAIKRLTEMQYDRNEIEFRVLIGINLLREGLDMPEVSLVAILDADKVGFLRSERSLIQTIGRAARHLNGTAIFYADRITGSMQRAIDEAERRHAKQLAYNTDHGITPKGESKCIKDIIDGVCDIEIAQRELKAAQELTAYQHLDEKKLTKEIKRVEKEMLACAKNLEFERAAQLRESNGRRQNRHVDFSYRTKPVKRRYASPPSRNTAALPIDSGRLRGMVPQFPNWLALVAPRNQPRTANERTRVADTAK